MAAELQSPEKIRSEAADDVSIAVKRGRGRPRKNPTTQKLKFHSEADISVTLPAKRGRGRPSSAHEIKPEVAGHVSFTVAKKRRGRPPKEKPKMVDLAMARGRPAKKPKLAGAEASRGNGSTAKVASISVAHELQPEVAGCDVSFTVAKKIRRGRPPKEKAKMVDLARARGRPAKKPKLAGADASPANGSTAKGVAEGMVLMGLKKRGRPKKTAEMTRARGRPKKTGTGVCVSPAESEKRPIVALSRAEIEADALIITGSILPPIPKKKISKKKQEAMDRLFPGQNLSWDKFPWAKPFLGQIPELSSRL